MVTSGSSYSTSFEGPMELRDLAEESVGLRKVGLGFVDRRMLEGTGCFFRKELDLDFI